MPLEEAKIYCNGNGRSQEHSDQKDPLVLKNFPVVINEVG